MKKVIITGAGQGIGEATVHAAIAEGYFVIATDKDDRGLEKLRDRYTEQQLETCVADLAEREVVQNFIGSIYERHAVIEGLVNNAGIYHGKSVYAYSDAEMDELWQVNVKALVYLSKDFAAQEKEAGRPRSIVNIASTAGEVGSCDALYGATKAAVIGLTKANAWNFAPHVRVNTVSPALVRNTAIFDRIPEYRSVEYARQEVLDTPLQPSGVADVILFLLSEKSRHMTGKVIPVDNGAYPR